MLFSSFIIYSLLPIIFLPLRVMIFFIPHCSLLPSHWLVLFRPHRTTAHGRGGGVRSYTSGKVFVP